MATTNSGPAPLAMIAGPSSSASSEAQDASIAYRMNQSGPGPDGRAAHGSTSIKAGWSDDEFAAIVCHGYPTATSFGGYHLHPIAPALPPSLPYGCSTAITHVDGTYSYTTVYGKAKSGQFTADSLVAAARRAPRQRKIRKHQNVCIARGAI